MLSRMVMQTETHMASCTCHAGEARNQDATNNAYSICGVHITIQLSKGWAKNVLIPQGYWREPGCGSLVLIVCELKRERHSVSRLLRMHKSVTVHWSICLFFQSCAKESRLLLGFLESAIWTKTLKPNICLIQSSTETCSRNQSVICLSTDSG